MASISLFLDTRNKKSERFPLVLRVAHKGNRKDLPTGYKLAASEWNDSKKVIKSTFGNATRENTRLRKKMSVASEVLLQMEPLLYNLTVRQVGELIQERLDDSAKQAIPAPVLEKHTGKTLLKVYGEKVTARYEKAKRFGMANAIQDAVGLFLRFHGNDELYISEINETFLEDLEADYLGKGNKVNGLGVRLRSIRRVYNLAIKDKDTELSADDYPFGRGKYSIRTERAKKRAVKLDVIEAIRKLSYPEGSSLWHHRNYFLFMFNMRGMNFIDLAFLPTSAASDGRLKYKRRKTKRGSSVKAFDLKITEEARRILDYYADPRGDQGLAFPIMRDVISLEDEERIYKVYKNRLCNHNRRLITIGKSLGISENLTTYVARHTFATAGLHKGVSKAQIGDMLGHTNYYTTEAYFDDFDREVLDDAADQILQ
ncbi:site-specific integrase [Tunicatimonas pelagia]|uniref:site-specific integrase n=1 Tax=Tunicatimonas pelagia TaxID=931531 RepID=UPI00266597CC|nr:site-specific integrase [Tunicatimonas pelagia]WKN44960.1 site-specific integrase [Tunicatimonas pelagia]